MSSPIITFRLTPNQLARSLQIARSLNPNFKLTSLSQLIKTVYIDYLADTAFEHIDPIDPKALDEITNLIHNPQKKTINLSSLVDAEQSTKEPKS